VNRSLTGADRAFYLLGDSHAVTALAPREAERLAYERGLHLAAP